MFNTVIIFTSSSTDESQCNLFINYSLYFGGKDEDTINDVFIFNGYSYILGTTFSNDFPTTLNAVNRTINGGSDVFLSILNENGTILIYSTFLGGSSHDIGRALHIDSEGYIYITGYTYSDDFPTTFNAINTTCNDLLFTSDIFICILNPGGTELIYSSYLGGSNSEIVNDIFVDKNDYIYLLGYTLSENYPTTLGVINSTHNANINQYSDVFITKLNPNGVLINCSTYLGGSNNDIGTSLILVNDNTLLVLGTTISLNFPTTFNAFDMYNNGFKDIFLTQINNNFTDILYSSYIGGSNHDEPNSFCIDQIGNIYITGYTESADFPTTSTAYDTIYNGKKDVFLSKLNSDLYSLNYSTFIGGEEDDIGMDLCINNNNEVNLIGYSYDNIFDLTSNGYPMTYGAYDRVYNGGSYDCIISVINSIGTELLYSTYIGGTDQDTTSKILCTNNNILKIFGQTISMNFPIVGSHDFTTNNGGSDLYIIKTYSIYDSDSDQLLDSDEICYFHTNPFDLDSDHDGLTDGTEIFLGTDPNDKDTDNDLFNDKIDIAPLSFLVPTGIIIIFIGGFIFIIIWKKNVKRRDILNRNS